ncbi:tungstate transport system ATP-binding protein [Cytobacillus eiseniae]|uniref:Tungstate transport system ATP-binding protein n=1 Tax=Cytobacillus eiseniae TaxID=762947 RepID=A0ABS4RBX0_9BACI|nr:ATP-binding cassette domain-containing protein [Cytobacillus eiseniae]MBP2240397.1 tungstate transport system ATP-binding protein [Cytobacillus eiseniae]
MNPIIRLENIHYRNKDRMILSVPQLSIEQGEILGIMGPNGAGKSTLLKTLSCLQAPSAGRIFYHHNALPTKNIPLEQRRKWAVVLQQTLIFDTTVFHNVAAGLKIRHVPRKEIKEKVEFWLEKFGIAHLAKKNAHQLSGGEAQRVNLARALILDPEVLYLDEPFSALDFPTKVKLLKDFKSIIKDTDMTTIFVSHDLTEVKFMTDRLAILMNGEIVQIGSTLDVVTNPNAYSAPFMNEMQLPIEE